MNLVEVKDFSFSYPECSHKVLEHVNLKIKEGTLNLAENTPISKPVSVPTRIATRNTGITPYGIAAFAAINTATQAVDPTARSIPPWLRTKIIPIPPIITVSD